MVRAATAIGFLLILVFLNCRYTLAFFAIISVLVEFLSMITRIVSRSLIYVFQNYLKQFPTMALTQPPDLGDPCKCTDKILVFAVNNTHNRRIYCGDYVELHP